MTGTDRAVSDTLAFTLVFTIIITSVGFTGVYGVEAVEDISDSAQANTAERSMTSFARGVGAVRDNRAPQHVQRLELSGDRLQTADAEIRIEIGYEDDSYTNETVPVESFVRRTDSGTRFIYTAGATFRSQPNGEVVTGTPALRCGSDTAHVSLVRINGQVSQSSDGPVTVRANAQNRESITPLSPDKGVKNVSVNVRNTRHTDAWERLFESELPRWNGGNGRYTCDGIDRAVVHNTTVGIAVN
ncbi:MULTISPECIES: DUF7289 family protein [Halomicrobium]|uniref:Uncharacterized protein n=2 Tax=Halomicrobium mukohataei TaxID=57705 RepID=C7NWP5_HALMD|nr:MULTISPECIES: hypothetical protein [Halomicrobium]ACV48255.1 hypothetical protein Hmuk_2142 [Halomicrobium mukohataei DSM 12286]QCD66675.1 hypothetical protein E5139_13855 [Halomicrobium mukohataei]QFR21481.1 hypothetical protein GBQ70_13870 [Halomicrobium sp. ZPS1]